MHNALKISSRLIPILGLAMAACSSGGGGGGGGAQGTGRIAGRAVLEANAAQRLASPGAPRRNDDDALRARDLGDLGAGAPVGAGGGFDDRNRADWLRAGMTTTGSARVRLTADAAVGLTVYRLRGGNAPHEAVHSGRGTSMAADVAVDAGDHLLLAVQGETGTYELQLANSAEPAPLTAMATAELTAANATLADALPEAVPGDVIVCGADEAALVAAQRLGFEVLARRDDVVRLRSVLGTALRADATGRAALADALFRVRRALPQARWVEPNLVVRTTRQPNDEFFRLQWAAQATNLTQAWDATIGEPVVIAVVDTGILKNHPDLRSKVLPDGFDFVSDPNNGDGDGIDADPEDIIVRGNDFHGSHVAGIAAAATDNGSGIAGVNWNARILPLRVLSPNGGSLFDVAEAIRYAAGLRNVSGRTPAQPARVVNLSLGGRSDSAVLHDAVRAASQAGAILVVAAGNAALEGNPVEFPAAYEEVITVGSVGPTLGRAPYSGFRDYVDVAAPGGDTSLRAEDGILSTVAVERNNEFFFGFAFYQGTSMAAPFVAGAVSLLLSVNPGLTFQDVMAILAQTSRDRGAPGRDAEFGFGLIDVAAAVAAARNGGGGGGGEPRLRLDRTEIEFTPDRLTQPVRITSSVPGREIGGLDAGFVGQGPQGVRAEFSATTTPATLTLEVTPQLAAQPQSFTIAIVSTVTQDRLDLQVRIAAGGGGGANGALVVELLDGAGQVVQRTETASGAFAFEAVAAGSYRVRAGVDSDRNGRITDIGDFASDDTPVVVAAGASADTGTLRARRVDTERGGLTGQFGHTSFGSGASNNVVYTFRTNGVVDRLTIFSSTSGTFESNARGTFTVRGDSVSIAIDGEAFDAAIERADGQIVALRIGRDRYARL